MKKEEAMRRIYEACGMLIGTVAAIDACTDALKEVIYVLDDVIDALTSTEE